MYAGLCNLRCKVGCWKKGVVIGWNSRELIKKNMR